jgi:hypothetical protein
VWTAQSKTVTSHDMAELRPEGMWLNSGSHPDFSAAGTKIEFGFWRASDNAGGASGGPTCTDMYYCIGGGPSAGPVASFYGVKDWFIGLNIQQVTPTVSESLNSGSSDDPVSTATGAYYELVPQLSLRGPLPLYFTRYYGSLLSANGVGGALGNNWTHNFVRLFRGRRVKFSQAAGSGWRLAADAAGRLVRVDYHSGASIEYVVRQRREPAEPHGDVATAREFG